MGPRALIVHIGCPDSPVLEAHIHVLLHFRDGIHLYLHQIFNENPLIRTLLELHLCLDILAEEVVDLLIVNFDEAAPDQMCLRCIVFCDGDYLTEGTRDYASSLLGVRSTYHRMCLSAACLAIGEDGAIVTIEHVFHEREGTLLVYITLRGLS